MTEIDLSKIQATLDKVTRNPISAYQLFEQLTELGVQLEEKAPEFQTRSTTNTPEPPTPRETILTKLFHPHHS